MEQLLIRESFYLQALKPEYNILKVAGSTIGFKHSADTKELLKSLHLGRDLSLEHVDKIRIGSVNRRSIMVTNTQTDEVFTFLSQNQAAEYLNVSSSTVGKYLEANLPYKGYTFTLLSPLSNQGAEERVVLEKKVANNISQTVIVVNNDTGDSREFYSVTEAAKILNVSRRLLTEHLNRSESLTNDDSAHSILPGYHISRGAVKKKVSKSAVPIEVVNVETNETTVYPSITLAGEALGINQRSISSYFSQNQTLPYKNKYIFKKVR